MSRVQKSLARTTTRPQTNAAQAAAPHANHKKPAPKARAARLEDEFSVEQRRINQGVANGSLTAAEAQQLQSKLDGLHARFERDAFEHKGSKPKLVGPGRELRHLREATTTAAGNDAIDVDKAAGAVDQHLAAGLADGTLTSSEASTLKQKADELKVELLLALTPEDKKTVAQKFRALDQELAVERKDADFDAAKRKGDLEAGIAAGLADGSLTKKEAEGLRKQVSHLDGARTQAWERVTRDLFEQGHDRQVNKPVMGASLRNRLASLESSGQLNPAQADSLRRSLDAALARGAVGAGARLNELRERLATDP